MNDQQLLERIVRRSEVMTGKPVIRGTRLTVEFVLNLRAHGASEEILDEYSRLTREDIQTRYLFSRKNIGERVFYAFFISLQVQR